MRKAGGACSELPGILKCSAAVRYRAAFASPVRDGTPVPRRHRDLRRHRYWLEGCSSCLDGCPHRLPEMLFARALLPRDEILLAEIVSIAGELMGPSRGQERSSSCKGQGPPRQVLRRRIRRTDLIPGHKLPHRRGGSRELLAVHLAVSVLVVPRE